MPKEQSARWLLCLATALGASAVARGAQQVVHDVAEGELSCKGCRARPKSVEVCELCSARQQ
ncbi:MAG TPA: hypothetical protein VM695_09260 [Phycisphaerae bacterium]|nr:hypothetical protein [Phycisphaerae bacterium]